MTNGSLMKVERIAEFCNTFDLHGAIIGLKTNLGYFTVVSQLYYGAILKPD